MTIYHKVCVVGGGNITNTRHIPALRKTKRVSIVGLIGKSKEDINKTALQWGIPNVALFDSEEKINSLSWLNDVDFVVLGVPPREHFKVAKLFLNLKKNVLIEKPFVMNIQEGNELISLAKKNGVKLFVMHNFQFTTSFQKLDKKIKNGDLGEVTSYFELQLTNDTRRLPSWYNNLPLGLFFDEAAHFIYLLQRLEGDVEVLNSNIFPNADEAKNTPIVLDANLLAGRKPVHLMINFQSPICEWFFVVYGKNKIAIFDFFRDILVTIPNDGQHLAIDVISNSFNFTFQHWLGTVVNGLKMITGNLLYGQDRVMSLALDAIDKKLEAAEINEMEGIKSITTLNQIIDFINHKDRRA
jgi:predicted dehydrogenase